MNGDGVIAHEARRRKGLRIVHPGRSSQCLLEACTPERNFARIVNMSLRILRIESIVYLISYRLRRDPTPTSNMLLGCY